MTRMPPATGVKHSTCKRSSRKPTATKRVSGESLRVSCPMTAVSKSNSAARSKLSFLSRMLASFLAAWNSMCMAFIVITICGSGGHDVSLQRVFGAIVGAARRGLCLRAGDFSATGRVPAAGRRGLRRCGALCSPLRGDGPDFDQVCAPAYGQVRDRDIFAFAGAGGDDGGPACGAGGCMGLPGAGDGAGLVDLDQRGVAGALACRRGDALRVADQVVVADDERAGGKCGGGRAHADGVMFARRVFDGDDGVGLQPLADDGEPFGAREAALFCRQVVAAVALEFAGGDVQRNAQVDAGAKPGAFDAQGQ